MSLDVSRHVWVARTDPKRRTWSTASYVHTLGRHGIGYDQPITITQRQSGAAIEGALRQTLAPIQQIFTDTHGYSAWAMGLSKHCGYDLCPRLKSFPDRRLHVPKGDRIKIPESLKDVVLADISIEDIEKGWSEFSAVCDAVAAGRISAVLACERFGSASRGEKAYQAGHAYGLLLRTLHLCDTLTLEEFSRETLRALNHNERTHSLQRQIRRDGPGSRRGRRTEELVAQSGALALVTNLVMSWNTHHMQATLDRWRVQNREIDPQIFHHITPMGFEGINFGGILVFPLERYRSRLLPSSPPPPTTMVAQTGLTACELRRCSLRWPIRPPGRQAPPENKTALRTNPCLKTALLTFIARPGQHPMQFAERTTGGYQHAAPNHGTDAEQPELDLYDLVSVRNGRCAAIR